MDEKKVLRVLTLAPDLEQQIIASRAELPGGAVAALEPELQRKYITSVTNAVKKVQEEGYNPLLLCSEAARPLVKSSTIREIPYLAAISVPEVVPDVTVEALAEIQIAN